MEVVNSDGIHDTLSDDNGYHNYYNLAWLGRQQDIVRSQTLARCQREKDNFHKMMENLQNTLNRDKTLHALMAQANRDTILDLELQLTQKKTDAAEARAALVEAEEKLVESSRLWEEEKVALLVTQEVQHVLLSSLQELLHFRHDGEANAQEVNERSSDIQDMEQDNKQTSAEAQQQSHQGNKRRKKIWARFLNIFHKKNKRH